MGKKKLKLFDRVYEVVRNIPKGKVATYGQIAVIMNDELVSGPLGSMARGVRMNYGKRVSPKIVGWALHANSDRGCPCHRVVNKHGKVAENYAFEGWKEQKRRLIKEGVGFVGEKRVDIEKYLWQSK